jgi:hypothetical protein
MFHGRFDRQGARLLDIPGKGHTATEEVVAQISKSAVSQVSNLRGASKFRPPADLGIGDTAGLEARATGR